MKLVKTMAHGLYHTISLVINALGGGHTDRQTHAHTDAQTKAISRNQARVAFGRAHLV